MTEREKMTELQNIREQLVLDPVTPYRTLAMQELVALVTLEALPCASLTPVRRDVMHDRRDVLACFLFGPALNP